MPKLSVVIPVYNASRYLRAAVASVQAQTFTDFEIIAVDDGSTDDSQKILAALATTDPRIRVISRPNTGIVGALNDGLEAARGEFIARMDADDVCMPDRFARQVSYLHTHTDTVALGTDILFTDPDGAALDRLRPRLEHTAIVAQLIDANGGAIIHPTLMARREAIERIGGYRPETLNFLEDLDLFLRLSEVGRLANLPDVLLHYRQHLKSINRLPGPRDAVRQQIVNPFRRKFGLAEFEPTPPDPEAPKHPADWRRTWAYEAARGHHWDTAKKNAHRAVLGSPWDRRNWRCLKYVWLGAKQPAANPKST